MELLKSRGLEGMLVYREVTSMVTSRILKRRGMGKEQRMERKWLESLMCEGRDWTMGWRWKSAPGPSSIENDAHGNEKLLLKTQVS